MPLIPILFVTLCYNSVLHAAIFKSVGDPKEVRQLRGFDP